MTKIAVIDADFLFFVALTGEKILDKNNEPIKIDGKFTYRERTFEESCNIADNYITNLLNVTEATHYIGFHSGSSLSRKYINSEYKANRKNLEPLPNLELLKNHFRHKWNFVRINPDYSCLDETDDYVASFVKQVPNSFIVSPDKDLLGLEGTHYNPKRNEWITNESWVADVNFWKSMITGDTVDNIKGIPGKGEKYANKVIVGLDNDFKKYVLEEYVNFFGEYKGIEEFYKNYKCLKIKTDLITDSFTPIKWNRI
jgi:predicted nucleic acid-binding protein